MKTSEMIAKLRGPIFVFGAGGFIGTNLLRKLIETRLDVYGLSQNYRRSYRLNRKDVPRRNLINCDLNRPQALKRLFEKYQPKTVFNLAAYGAYSSQKDIEQIYKTNFLSAVSLLELVVKHKVLLYVQTGSSSEYGLNSASPNEQSELIPNSHYAVSKASLSLLCKYYGKVLRQPVVHLRLYSVYGPFEEPSRLIPTLIKAANKGHFPKLVHSQISRDFIYIDDVISAFLTVGTKLKPKHFGDSFNVGTGKKTTIRQLALLTQKLFQLKDKPQFGQMINRRWDLANWYGNYDKMLSVFGWKPKYILEKGLLLTAAWQKKYSHG